MSYFADMSPYNYPAFKGQSHAEFLNIGWLDAGHAYNRGFTDGVLLDKLVRLSATPVNRARGHHRCPFCDVYPVSITRLNITLDLGDAEIRVPGRVGIVFVCPTMICHYIQDHHYHPPDEFLNALASNLSQD